MFLLVNIDTTYLYGKAWQAEFEKPGLYEQHGKRGVATFFFPMAFGMRPPRGGKKSMVHITTRLKEKLKDKALVREAFTRALFGVTIVVLPLTVALKMGISRYRTYDSPLNWSEFFSILPFVLLGATAFFMFLFVGSLFEEETKYLICKGCLKHFSEKSVKGDTCPDCGDRLEASNGCYERHPAIRNKVVYARKKEFRKMKKRS